MRICNKCNIEKVLNSDNFRICKHPNGKEYFKARCRQCEKESVNNYNTNHRDEKKLYSRKYLENNPMYIKDWKNSNKDKVNTKYREKFHSDTNFRLRKNFSRAISRALKNNNSSKFSQSILQYLPYSIGELKISIENQFDSRMSWGNYAIYWEIDHIIPQSDLPYDSMDHNNFQKCWALENLKPYPIKLNRSEGASKVRHNINNNVLL